MDKNEKKALQAKVKEIRNEISLTLLKKLDKIVKEYGIDVNNSYIGNAYGSLQDAYDWLGPASSGKFDSDL